MNQNMPSDQPGSPQGYGDGARQTFGQEFDARDGADNPYVRHRNATAPDLDANAPLLKSNDLQRLNRKALVFLAGIVGLLIIMAVWMFTSATASDDPMTKPREEKVVIPELPEEPGNVPGTMTAKPIPVESYMSSASAPELPPLPVESPAPPVSGFASDVGPPPSHASTLRERRMDDGDDPTASVQGVPLEAYAQAMLAGMPGLASNASASQQPSSARAGANSAQYINNPDALLVRGTYVRCVLETRIITDIPGFTSCVVTEPVYSINGRSLLLPKGSKISGSYDAEPNGPRVSVVWDRITTPNGIDVNMASPGVDNLGGAGHPGDYDAHWGARISSALMISLLSDAFKYAAAKNGPPMTTVSNGIVTQQPFESNTAQTMERLANQALDASMHRPATVTINQGTVVNVYVAKDVDFSGVLSRR